MAINYADRNTGKPLGKIPTQSGGWKNPDKRHAMKVGAVPRTTSILNLVQGYVLGEYKQEQVARWAYHNPPTPEIDEDTYTERGVEGGNEHSKGRAERGTEIHAEVEGWLNGIEVLNGYNTISTYDTEDPCAKNVIKSLLMLFEEIGPVKVVSEWNFVRQDFGYAGTCDLYVEAADGTPWIIDLKTTKTEGLNKPHDSWVYQLGGYFKALCDGEKEPEFAQLVFDQDSSTGWEHWLTPTGRERKGSEEHKVYFNAGTPENPATVEIAGVYLYSADQRKRGCSVFEGLLELWKGINEYWPENWVEGGAE